MRLWPNAVVWIMVPEVETEGKTRLVVTGGRPEVESVSALLSLQANSRAETPVMSTTASWYHANVKSISRGKGKTFVGAVAYITGEPIYDQENKRTCYRGHPGEVVGWFMVAPECAPQRFRDKLQIDRVANEVQASESRTNAQFSNHWDVASWRHFTPEQHMALAERIATRYMERYKVMVVAAVHEPSGQGSADNWHIHLVPNMRRIDENGIGEKAKEITDGKTRHLETEWVRRMIADELNSALAMAHSDERVSHQSYRQRGILKQPMIHMGNNAWQAEKRGIATDPGDWNRQIRAMNADIEATKAPEPKQQRKKKMEPEEQYAEDQRRAFDSRIRQQLDMIERMAESGKERDRFRLGFEADQAEAEKRDRDRLYQRTQDADITDARGRWMDAVAASPKQREWEQTLAAAVAIEGARAKGEHDELTKAAKLEKDPDKQKDILLRRDVQFWEFMALTEERQVGISRGITGYTQRRDLNEPDDQPVKRPWEVHRDAAMEYREIANQLRQEREEHNERAALREIQKIDRDITAGGERIFAAARAKQEATHTTDQVDGTPQNRRDGQWREVDSDKEIFEPGRQFQFNQTTGKPEVWEPAQTKEEQIGDYLARESNAQNRLDIDQRNDGYALVRNGEDVLGWAPTRDDLHELIIDRINREQGSQPQRENPFDTYARQEGERRDAAREMTESRKERTEREGAEPELSDLAKERMAMLGMQWNAEERQQEQTRDRGRGSGMGR